VPTAVVPIAAAGATDARGVGGGRSLSRFFREAAGFSSDYGRGKRQTRSFVIGTPRGSHQRIV
jgi:hypothetical protein